MNIALIGPDLTGHLNPFTALGRELASRGHRVTLFSLPEGERFAKAAGIEFAAMGGPDYETRIMPARTTLAGMTGYRAMAFTGKLLMWIEELMLRDLPDQLKARAIDFVLTDQVSPGGACAAEFCRIPFVTVCNALHLRQEPAVPPGVLGWRYRTGFLARIRNRFGNLALTLAARPIRKSMEAWRLANGLPPVRDEFGAANGIGEVAQQPDFFDFPRERAHPHFSYTAPWHLPHRDQAIDFPWDRLDDRPLVYASLGTLQNGLKPVFTAILDGCRDLPVQVVLALGNKTATYDGPIPSNAIVAPFAPQLALLDRASFIITHAGLNTALETLARGKPMICLPITNDQPGVASRVEYLGAGLVCPASRVTADRIKAMMNHLLTNSTYRTKAEWCREKLAGRNGPAEAANIILDRYRSHIGAVPDSLHS